MAEHTIAVLGGGIGGLVAARRLARTLTGGHRIVLVDVTTIPLSGGKFLPNAGVFAHGQADAVARRIAAELAGHAPSAAFDGRGACFVEMGDGVAAYATGDFYAETEPEVRLRRPGRHWHVAKVAFEKYWLRRWCR